MPLHHRRCHIVLLRLHTPHRCAFSAPRSPTVFLLHRRKCRRRWQQLHRWVRRLRRCAVWLSMRPRATLLLCQRHRLAGWQLTLVVVSAVVGTTSSASPLTRRYLAPSVAHACHRNRLRWKVSARARAHPTAATPATATFSLRGQEGAGDGSRSLSPPAVVQASKRRP